MFGKKGISTQNIADALNLLEKYLIDHNLKLSGYMSVVNGAREELALIKKYAATNLAHYTEMDKLVGAFDEYERSNGRKAPCHDTCSTLISWLLEKMSVNRCESPSHISCSYGEREGDKTVCKAKKETRDACPFRSCE